MRKPTHSKILSDLMFNQKTIYITIFLAQLIGFSSAAFAQQAKALKSADLLSEPVSSASKTGSLSPGLAVSVLDKKGFWVKVQSGNQNGWVKLTDIELPNTVIKIDPMATGRTSGGNIVNTAGVRGLSPEELKGSKPNTAAVDQAVQNAAKVSDADISSFASSGGVISRGNIPEVKVIKVTSSGNVSKPDGVGMGVNQSNSGPTGKQSKESKEW